MVKHQCPCGAKYKFEPQHAGKRAKCKRCGAVFVVPTEEQHPDMIPIADAPVGLMEEVAAAVQRGAPPPPPPVPGPFPPGMTAPPPVVIEPPEDISEPLAVPGEGGDYASSLAQSFLFASSANNLVIFVIMWVLLLVSELLPHAPGLGILGMFLTIAVIITIFVIYAWYCAFRLNTIIEAAQGEADLPALTFTDGFLEDGLIPLFRWVGSWLIALAPAIVFAAVTGAYALIQWSQAAGGIGALLAEAADGAPVFLALLGAGLFFWPMIVLCVSIGGFSTLGRPDLIISTIFRTFPAYILTVVMVFGTVAMAWFMAAAMQGTGTTPNLSDVLVKSVFLVGVGLYLDIVAMRAIGLYYYHFKNRFAWDW